MGLGFSAFGLDFTFFGADFESSNVKSGLWYYMSMISKFT